MGKVIQSFYNFILPYTKDPASYVIFLLGSITTFFVREVIPFEYKVRREKRLRNSEDKEKRIDEIKQALNGYVSYWSSVPKDKILSNSSEQFTTNRHGRIIEPNWEDTKLTQVPANIRSIKQQVTEYSQKLSQHAYILNLDEKKEIDTLLSDLNFISNREVSTYRELEMFLYTGDCAKRSAKSLLKIYGIEYDPQLSYSDE